MVLKFSSMRNHQRNKKRRYSGRKVKVHSWASFLQKLDFFRDKKPRRESKWRVEWKNMRVHAGNSNDQLVISSHGQSNHVSNPINYALNRAFLLDANQMTRASWKALTQTVENARRHQQDKHIDDAEHGRYHDPHGQADGRVGKRLWATLIDGVAAVGGSLPMIEWDEARLEGRGDRWSGFIVHDIRWKVADVHLDRE